LKVLNIHRERMNYIKICGTDTCHVLTQTHFCTSTFRNLVFICSYHEWMIGGSIPNRCWEFFSSPQRPDLLWGSSSLLSNGYQGLFL